MVISAFALLVALWAAFSAHRSSRAAMLANAPEMFVQCAVRPLNDEDDQLHLSIVNSGPTEALDLYVELYPRLSQTELNDDFPTQLPLSTWREPRVLAKASINLTSRMLMYRGLGLDPGFYSRGFLFAWVFWKDRLGNRYSRLTPVYDLDFSDCGVTSSLRTIGPTKVSPSAQAQWKIDAKRRKRTRHRKRLPYQVIDPRIRMQSIYSVELEPGDFAKPIGEIFSKVNVAELPYPLLTITSEQEGLSPRMYAVSEEPGVVEAVWQYLQPWAEPVADTQIRFYTAVDQYKLVRVPWNHATVVEKVESILNQVRKANDAGVPLTRLRIRFNLTEKDGDRVSASTIISGLASISPQPTSSGDSA